MVRTAPRVRAGAALGVAGIALTLYDSADTGFAIRHHLESGNTSAAKSDAIHFGGRTVGVFAGAGVGMAAGAAAGIETGPGTLLAGAAGGLVGAFAKHHARAIIFAGQPGAGKGGLAGKAKAEFHGNAITIDPDALRDYHPRLADFRSAQPHPGRA